jgi:NTP pyrophosphatase (non-canonical NTP hydrolase)
MVDNNEKVLTNAEWAALQIIKHGKDRYPTPHEQFVKLVEEVGELGKALNKWLSYKTSEEFDPRRNQTKLYKDLKGEAADVALALYNFSIKCEFDLDKQIRFTVESDDRLF